MSTSTEIRAPERRERPRHRLQEVRGNLQFSRTCQVLNLSGAGMAIETCAALAPGRRYAFTIQHEGRPIALAGTVAWCRLQGTRRTDAGESSPSYLAGIELSDAADRERLDRLIREEAEAT